MKTTSIMKWPWTKNINVINTTCNPVPVVGAEEPVYLLFLATKGSGLAFCLNNTTDPRIM